MTDIKIFSLAGQGLKLDSRADMEPHLEALRAMADVEEVHLGGNTLGVEACRALAEVLEPKHTLKVADLADIFTGRLISEIPASLSALCDALRAHPSLEEINLSDNAFGGRSAEPMVNLLSQNTAIRVLKLNNNGLGPAGGEIVARALLASAEKSRSAGQASRLQVVVCGRNRLEDSARVWAEAFAAHATLREVTMQNDGIRMGAMLALIRGLAKCPDLELLDVQDNTLTEITDSGAIDLSGPRLVAKVLPGWPHLKVLNLSDCVLKPRGGLLLAKALAAGSSPKLEQLKLENSEVDPRTFGLLAEAISLHLPGLTLLEINANKGGEEHESVLALRTALARHGNEEALGELDEMEEVDEEEEEEEYLEVFPEAEEAEREEEEEPSEVPKKEEEEEVVLVTQELAEVKLDTPPEAVPAPEAAPAPETAPAPEAVPAPEITPAPETLPMPEVIITAPAEDAQTAPEAPAQESSDSTVPAAAIEAPAVVLPPAAAVSLPPSAAAPVEAETVPVAVENGSAAAENGAAEPSKDAPSAAPATPAAAEATPADPATPAKSAPTSFGDSAKRTVKKRKSVLGGLGEKLAGIFTPKRRVSQVPK